MANSRIGGIIQLEIEGEQVLAKGEFTHNLGVPKKTMIAGSDSIHGFMEKPQVPFIEGAITDNDELDMEALRRTRDKTITLTMANGKVFVLEKAVEASDGSVKSDEGEAEVRFEGISGREIAS